MVSFPINDSGVTNFSGTLEELGKRDAVQVPTLLADQGAWKWTFGIVPVAPLKATTSYRATFKFLRGGSPVERVIHFQTE
jgi:hypothetical protein